MIKKILIVLSIILTGFYLIGCDTQENIPTEQTPSHVEPTPLEPTPTPIDPTPTPAEPTPTPIDEHALLLEQLRLSNPHNDIYYQIFVRSFADSTGNGIGDLNGITQNLDYLEALGITALWLLPINPSPSYHGYNVTDYYDIHPDYGTMEDFDHLIAEASLRGIKIVIDLVINHTSDQHPWFVSARSSSSSPYRDYYIWQGNNAFESFVGGMKDLNLNNPEVVLEVKNMMDFYLEKGVAGFRLDAAKHFFDKPGVVGADLLNSLFILELNRHIKTNFPNSFIVSEVFDYNYIALEDYYIGSDSVFNFHAASQIWNSVGNGNNRSNFANNLKRAYDAFRWINPDFVDSPFLTNHDLDRLASMGGFNGINGFERMRQATVVLLTLPGSPFIYYGEELGMKGYRDYSQDGAHVPGYGVAYDEYRRTPFLWGNPTIETTWFPDTQNFETQPVHIQIEDPNSLLNLYKTLTHLRLNVPALMYGNHFETFNGNSTQIQGYVRSFSYGDFEQAVLIIHNLSSDVRYVDVDYLNILYGSLELEPFGSVILEIDPSLIGDYT